jgi:hypothetical protein
MDKYIKIYIHHKYNISLFYKLFHNSEEIEINNDNDITNIFCSYKKKKLNLIFDKTINDNEDGYHLVDWFTSYYEIQKETPELLHSKNVISHDSVIFNSLFDILKTRKNWIVSVLRTEKIYAFDYESDDYYDRNHQEILNHISKNHKIVTDNFYLIDVSKKIKFNHVITNTLYQWNENIAIRWFYEFGKLYENLKFDYDLCFSVRNIKGNRIYIIEELEKFNNKKILLQITDSRYLEDTEATKPGRSYINKKFNSETTINLNSMIGEHHFDDLTALPGGFGFGLDYDLFFRYLSKSKVQILDESWGFYSTDYSIQYLSEKTIGYVLAKIPFIPTHIYPLQYLQNELDIEEYPFYKDILKAKVDKEYFIEFIKQFLDNFEQNYNLLKRWIDDVHIKYMNKINKENSLLDLIYDEFNTPASIVKNKSLF